MKVMYSHKLDEALRKTVGSKWPSLNSESCWIGHFRGHQDIADCCVIRCRNRDSAVHTRSSHSQDHDVRQGHTGKVYARFDER